MLGLCCAASFYIACWVSNLSLQVHADSTAAMSTTIQGSNAQETPSFVDYSRSAYSPTGIVASGKKTLTILGLFPMTGQWPGGRSMEPAVQLALEHINARQDILQNYTLQMAWGNTACDPGEGINSMYELLGAAPPKIMVLGAGCSPVTETTARASHLWNLTQISYVSASPALSNKETFPKFFRVGASDLSLNPTKIALLKHFGWSRVATIHESIEVFSLVTEDLVRRLARTNISLVTSEIFTDDPSLQVANLKHHDARIIFAGAHYTAIYKVMCEAYKAGLYGNRYVWVLPGWYQDGWWKDPAYDGTTDCTAEQIQAAVEGYMGLSFVYINPHQVRGISGHTPAGWQAEMTNKSDYPSLTGSYVAAQGYDAAWAIALALNHTHTQLQQMGMSYDLGSFQYNNSELAEMIFANMWKVDFQGIKGHIFYDDKGDCLDTVTIMRFQGDGLPVVAYHQPASGGEIQWVPEAPIIWRDGRPPKDSTLTVIELIFISDAVYATIVAIATIGVATSVLFLIFNITFRHERLIKLSSPVLNNIILVGCIVSYSTVIFQERSSETTQILCKVRSFTVMVGFSLSFGALFAKTWRVYVIFTNKTKKKVLHDSQLVGIVGALVLLDIILFGSQLIADPHSVTYTLVSTREEDFGDVIVEEKVCHCTSSYNTYFMLITYSVKGLLLIFGTFLSWQTRKVTIPALNDSHYIGLCIYNVVVLSLVAVLLDSVLTHQVTLQYVLVNSLLVLGVYITQFIIFIPKIYKYWSMRNKVGDDDGTKTVFAATGSATNRTGAVLSSATSSEDCQSAKCHTTIGALQQEVAKLKEELEKRAGTLSPIPKPLAVADVC